MVPQAPVDILNGQLKEPGSKSTYYITLYIYIYKINTRLYTKVSRKGGLRGAETKRE